MQNEVRAVFDALCAHPISQVFMKPMSESPYTGPDYLWRIRVPMDLSRIRSCLGRPDYNFTRFKRDINLIRTNTISYFGAESLFGRCATLLSQLYSETVTKQQPTTQEWGIRAVKLRRKMDRLLKHHPKSGGPPRIEIDLRTSNKLTDDDYLNFAVASEQLKSQTDVKAMIDIIERREPGVLSQSAELTINLAELKTSTVIALIEQAKRVFAERGIEYPH
jgi:hypothetical protein